MLDTQKQQLAKRWRNISTLFCSPDKHIVQAGLGGDCGIMYSYLEKRVGAPAPNIWAPLAEQKYEWI